MAWSPKTKPTPANIRKRLQAALEALEGAEALCDAHGGMAMTKTAIHRAQSWVGPGPGSAMDRSKGGRR
jgi:hypothetical protein